MHKNKTLILTVGLPRSGKTTWAQKQGHPIVNPDAIRLALHWHKFFGPAEPWVWAMAYTMVDALFKAGHNTVIVDATHVSHRRRVPWIEKFQSVAKITFEVFNTPPEECIRRAEAEGDAEIIPIIRRMAKEWDIPPYFEGYTGEEEKAG